MKIKSLDHLVLTVKDVKISSDFYVNVLGMEKIVFKENRIALKYGNQKINLHEFKNEFEPKAHKVMPGSADLCFIADDDITKVIHHLKSLNITILEGPIKRTGACGEIISLYIRDPDLNLIEISNYL
ncbi:MAG: VOC family virulence protein [Arcobacter sp.]|nr:MAG: VOC family virulence protein [Arcobacter sp.]